VAPFLWPTVYIVVTCKLDTNAMFLGDMAQENISEEDKPLNSVALAKFLSKAAKVAGLFIVCFVFRVKLSGVLILLLRNCSVDTLTVDAFNYCSSTVINYWCN